MHCKVYLASSRSPCCEACCLTAESVDLCQHGAQLSWDVAAVAILSSRLWDAPKAYHLQLQKIKAADYYVEGDIQAGGLRRYLRFKIPLDLIQLLGARQSHFGWLAGWLAGWLVGWLLDRLVGSVRRYSNKFGGIRRHSKVFGGIRKYMKAFGGIRRHSKVFGVIRRNSKVLTCIRRYSKVVEGIRRYSKVFGGI